MLKPLLFAAVLGLSSSMVIASTNQPTATEIRVNAIVKKFNAVEEFQHNIAVAIDKNGKDLGGTKLIDDGEGCLVVLGQTAVNAITDDNSLAFVLGHEIGHCELEHLLDRSAYTQHNAWRHEYEADAYSRILCAEAGYDMLAGMKALWGTKWAKAHVVFTDAWSHPGIERRLKAIQTGNFTYADVEAFYQGLVVSLILLLPLLWLIVFGRKRKYHLKDLDALEG